jgi:hypothetical protein
MYNDLFILLALLFVKHWYIDFVDQSMEEVNSKGNYGEWFGIRHSLKQGIGTFLVFALTDISFMDAWLFGLIDFALHYHIDWAKININRAKNYTIEMPQFWAWLGADQLAHSITYLFLVWLAI